MRRLLLCLSIGVAAFGALASPPPLSRVVLGLAELAPGREPCGTISDPEARQGEYAWLLFLDEEPRIVRARIGRTFSAPCTLADVRGVPFELVSADGSKLPSDGHALLVSFWPEVIRKTGERTWIAAGGSYEFEISACTSTEGIHYNVFYNSARAGHAYYFLASDVEENCSEREVEPFSWPARPTQRDR